jgi:hypothetical protein
MSQARVTTRPGVYADSVRLMQVSQLVGSADLLIAVRATDTAALDAAVDPAEQQLAARPLPREPGGAEGVPARTVRSVARQVGPALAMISVPGPDAFTEATDAVDAGCDVLETRTATTPVHFALVGSGCADLTAAAEDPRSRLGFHTPRWPEWLGRAPAPARGPASAPGASSRPVLRRRKPRTTIPPRKSH